MIQYSLYFYFSVFATHAQTSKYFIENYAWEINHNGYSIIPDPLGGYRIGGERLEYTTQKWNMFTIKMDEYGTLTDIDDYVEPFQTGMRKMLALSDGGFALAGFLGDVQANMYLLRADEQGSYVYGKFVGREAYTNHATTIIATPDGGFLMGGEIQPYDSTVTAPPTHPYLVKVNADGEMEWDTIFWDSQLPRAWFFEIKPLSDGNYLLNAPVNRSYGNTGNIWVIKINPAGTILWERVYDYGGLESAGDIEPTQDGGFIQSFHHKITDRLTYIVKSDDNGDMVWERSDLFPGGWAMRIIEQVDGSFIIAGYSRPNSNIDSELLKLTSNGDLLWRRTFGTPTDRPILLRHDRHARRRFYHVRTRRNGPRRKRICGKNQLHGPPHRAGSRFRVRCRRCLQRAVH